MTTTMTEQEFETKRKAICKEYDDLFEATKKATWDANWPAGWQETEDAILVPAQEKRKAALRALEEEFYGTEDIVGLLFPVTE